MATTLSPIENSGARLSPCGKYRYSLAIRDFPELPGETPPAIEGPRSLATRECREANVEASDLRSRVAEGLARQAARGSGHGAEQ